MILKFRVEGQTLFPLPTNDIPREGSRDYLKVEFDFGIGTEAYTKTVYFTSEAEGEEAPFSTAVVYEDEPIRVDDYFAQKSFAISVGFVLGERSYTTNEVSVPLDPASDVWLNLPPKPDIPAYQQLVNLAESAASSADSAAKDADQAANAANVALLTLKASSYIDVTDAYRADEDFRDQPQEYLRSLGAGKWQIDEGWALYQIDTLPDMEGTTWQDERYWTDDGFYNRKVSANGQEKVYLDSGDGVLRINGKPLSGAAELDWAAMDAVIGAAISEGGGGSSEGGGSTVGGVTEARMQAYVTERLKGYVTETAMKDYVKQYVEETLAAIPIAEERSYG